MNTAFSKTITKLRIKKGKSQKDAAAELGISQSLLSHYEKGIRECSLDFLIKIASYYEVSTDCLLGRESAEISEEIAQNAEEIKLAKANTYCLLNKRLINNCTSQIFSVLSSINNKKLSKYVSDYLSVANYKMLRQLEELSDEGSDTYTLESEIAQKLCSVSMQLSDTRISEIIRNINHNGKITSHSELEGRYEDNLAMIKELIKNSEKAIVPLNRI